MWALWVLLGLAVLIALLLLIPVGLVLKNDSDNNLTVQARVLCFSFDLTSPDKAEKPVRKAVKDAAGGNRIKEKKPTTSLQKNGLVSTVQDGARLATSALREVGQLVKRLHIDRLKLTVICRGEDAAAAAIHYGQCCAILYPLLGQINSRLRVNRRRQEVTIGCDYTAGDSVFLFDVRLSLRLCHVAASLLRIAGKEAAHFLQKSVDDVTG